MKYDLKFEGWVEIVAYNEKQLDAVAENLRKHLENELKIYGGQTAQVDLVAVDEK